MKILSVKLKSIITAMVIIAVVLGIFFMASTLSDTVSADDRMIPIYNVDKDTNEVAITFNCAMSGDIDKILDILNDYDIKCTFFLLGSWADDYIDEVQKIYDAGHEIGNHSYSHNDLPSMNYEDIILDIQKCNETAHCTLPPFDKCRKTNLFLLLFATLRTKRNQVFDLRSSKTFNCI